MTPGDRDERADAAARHSIEVLYQDNFAQVLAYALRRTATAEDAADVAAETFAVAWRRLDEVPAGDGARLWLYGVARHVVANQRRGEVRRRRLAHRLAAPAAAAVTVTRQGGDYVVNILRPDSDSRQLSQALRATGLDITLQTMPASPSLVGTILQMWIPGGRNYIQLVNSGHCRNGVNGCRSHCA
jgi:DNA-directed RNA polymerase specialized sigma24 family protein